MTTYHVDAAHVAHAAQKATVTGEAIRAEVTGLVAQLTELESSWQGTAQVAFTELLHQWRAAQAQLEQALDSMGTGLAHAAQQYEEAEATASRMFSR